MFFTNLASLARRAPAAAVLCLSLASAAACGKDDPTGPNTPSVLHATSARSASVALGTTQEVKLRVENVNGHPVSGVTVTFTADNGATLATPTATSGADGIATNTVTITNVDDPTVVTATVAGVTQPMTYKFFGVCTAPPAGTIDDFCGVSTTTWIGFNGISTGVSKGTLTLSGTGVGGANQYPGAVKNVGSSGVDFSATPKITVRMRNATTNSGDAYVQLALNDVNGTGANKYGSVAGGLMVVVPNDGQWHEYTFDFTGKFVQWNDVPVDATKIKEVVFLVQPNTTPTFTGTVEIDDIRRTS
jgi:hypothetical protein